MKTNEEYIDDYLDAYNNAKEVNRLSENRISIEFSLKTIEELRIYKQKSSQETYKLQQTRILEMLDTIRRPMTTEEFKEQFDRHAELKKEVYKEMIPYVLGELEKMTLPLSPGQVRLLTRVLYRKQITEEMIPKDVLDEYKKSTLYLNYSRTKKGKE